MKHKLQAMLGIVLSLFIVIGVHGEVIIPIRVSPQFDYIKNESIKLLSNYATNMYSMGRLSLPHNRMLPFKCMLRNVYMESRGEDISGKLKVASVVINRVHNKNYPSKICNVIYQPHQFSWTDNKKLIAHYKSVMSSHKKIDDKELKGSIWVAFYVVVFHGRLNTPATSYYAPAGVKSKPHWVLSKEFIFVERYGNHLFYILNDDTSSLQA